MKLAQEIARTKRSLAQAKPRSQRRVELELQLRLLIVRQLREENRQDKRKAA